MTSSIDVILALQSLESNISLVIRSLVFPALNISFPTERLARRCICQGGCGRGCRQADTVVVVCQNNVEIIMSRKCQDNIRVNKTWMVGSLHCCPWMRDVCLGFSLSLTETGFLLVFGSHAMVGEIWMTSVGKSYFSRSREMFADSKNQTITPQTQTLNICGLTCLSIFESRSSEFCRICWEHRCLTGGSRSRGGGDTLLISCRDGVDDP